MIEILQGSALPIAIDLVDEDTGDPITSDDVSNVELVIGNIRKTMTSGGITYDTEQKSWVFNLSQEETFSMSPTIYEPQCRIVLAGGRIPGAILSKVRIIEGRSKEVL